MRSIRLTQRQVQDVTRVVLGACRAKMREDIMLKSRKSTELTIVWVKAMLPKVMINCLKYNAVFCGCKVTSTPRVNGNEIAVALLLTKVSVGGINGPSSYDSRRAELVSNKLKYFNNVTSVA
jgi:hypothetical protein